LKILELVKQGKTINIFQKETFLFAKLNYEKIRVGKIINLKNTLINIIEFMEVKNKI
jgi:predicted RecA/RadA family phage recombinase